MSSTNRGGGRHASDYYRTPRWCIRRLLESGFLSDNARTFGQPLRLLDPMAGNGRFFEVFRDSSSICGALPHPAPWRWTFVEDREEERDRLADLCPDVRVGDFLEIAKQMHSIGEHYDLAITNPAFPIAFAALRLALTFCRRVTFLQRRNWLGSDERADFFRDHMPDEATLPNRPCFTLNDEGKPATDSIEYSFFTFHGAETAGSSIPLRPWGRSTILGSTSKEERRIEIDELLEENRRRPKAPTETAP